MSQNRLDLREGARSSERGIYVEGGVRGGGRGSPLSLTPLRRCVERGQLMDYWDCVWCQGLWGEVHGVTMERLARKEGESGMQMKGKGGKGRK